MIQQRPIQVRLPEVQADKLGFFRFTEVGGKMLLTNEAGEWHFLSPADFQTFLKGDVEPGHPEFEGLRDKGFVRAGSDLEALAAKIRRKRYYLDYGPHLHGLITTLRCNQACKYCHASRTEMDRVDTDMAVETALKAVDMAFQSTSPYICFEYTGGEPTVNMPIRAALMP